MPEYIVTAPDGSKLRVTAPEGATEQDAIRYAQEQYSAAQQPVAPAAPTQFQKAQASIGGRVLQGMRDPVDAAAQLAPRALKGLTSLGGFAPNPVSEFFDAEAKRVDAINARNNEAYEAARAATGQEGFDGGRLVGNIASPVNAAVAGLAPLRAGMGLMPLALRGAAGGAVGGMLTPVNDPEAQDNFWTEKAKQTALGAVTGALLTPALVRGTEASVRRFIPLSMGDKAAHSADVDRQIAEAFREVGQDPATLGATAMQTLRDQAMASLAKGRKLDVAAALRSKDFKSLNIDPLLGQVTRDPMLYAREMNLRGVEGVGDPILARLSAQRRQLSDVLQKFSAGAVERADAGEQFSNVLKSTDDAMSKRVSDLYAKARASSKSEFDIPLAGFAQDVADVMDRFGDKVPSGVMNQVRALGLLGGTQRRVFTLADADRFAKVINDNVGNDTISNTALSELRRGLRRAVTEAVPIGDNPFAPAVKAASERFSLLDALPALKTAAQGKGNEDTFVREFIFKEKPSQVRELASLLKRENPEAYAQARQQIGAFLQRAAFGQNQAGDKAFAPERFAGALDSLGTARLKAFFTPDEISQLQAVGRVGAYIGSEPAFSAVNRSNTSSAAANMILAALRKTPGGSSAVSVAGALAAPVVNSRRASAALGAKVPQEIAELTPQQVRALRLIAPPLIVGSGIAGATAGR